MTDIILTILAILLALFIVESIRHHVQTVRKRERYNGRYN